MKIWKDRLRFVQQSTRSRRGRRRRQDTLRVESLEGRVLLAADLVAVTPVEGSEGVSSETDLVLTFGEDVQPGPGLGNIFLFNAEDDSLIEAVNVNSDRVTFDGATVTVDPVAVLPQDNAIYVQIDAGAVRDLSTDTATATLMFEDFEGLDLKNSSFDAVLDDYTVLMTGTLNVTVAGDYTFGGNSDDGQALYIDVGQDGLDIFLPDFEDELIFDNTTHGNEDRLSVCGFDFDGQSCEGSGGDAVNLAEGEYDFAYLYFERGGGSSGEFFYAPGTLEAFDPASFFIVGDAAGGIGVTEAGITATTYKAESASVGDMNTALDLIDGFGVAEGFPVSETIPTADVHNSGGFGRFNDNHPVPGGQDPSQEDFSEEGPFGWTTDDSFLLENRPGAPAEYEGWTFMRKDLWIQEQGDQSRTDYELGEGVVALVDPDAYDDFVDIDATGGTVQDCLDTGAPEPCGWFKASMDTPQVYLNGAVENTARIKFDSSWWDEDTQSAEMSVEYFDAEGESISSEVVLRWESIQSSENYKPQAGADGSNARNETLEYDLNNPAGADSMVITFSMPYAQNDWWWAVDNIEITAEVAGETFAGIDDQTTWTFTTGGGVVEPPVDPCEFGDIDGDGEVGFGDFVILSNNWQQQVTSCADGDVDADGEVGFGDFVILSNNWGQAIPAAAAAIDDAWASLADEDLLDLL